VICSSSEVKTSYRVHEYFYLSWLKGGLFKAKFDKLSTLAFIERKENVFFLGPSCTGKTHLMLALGRQACLSGDSTYYMSCHDLVEELVKSKEQNILMSSFSLLIQDMRQF
jgi:DNA replication protein DnaC